MPLRPHQVRAAEQFVKQCTDTGMLLWHRMGTGKTNTVLATLMNYPHDRVLLLLPKALKDVWVQEIEKNFGGAVPFQLQIIDFDTFFNKHMAQQVKEAVAKASLVVADEAHHLAEHAHMSRDMLRGKRCLLVTGTPVYHALTDLAVLVNIAADADEDVLPLKRRKLEQLVQRGDMYARIHNYVQFYDFAADAPSQQHVIYPSVRLVKLTANANQLPVAKPGSIVYTQSKDKLKKVADQLQRAGVPMLYLQNLDQQVLDAFATGHYVLLLDGAVAEGVSIPNANVLHVLEPVSSYGLQEQLYARLKRPVSQPALHTIYQYIQPGVHVDHTLANLVRQLRQQMARQQTNSPTCGLRVRERNCTVWMSPTSPGTCQDK